MTEVILDCPPGTCERGADGRQLGVTYPPPGTVRLTARCPLMTDTVEKGLALIGEQ